MGNMCHFLILAQFTSSLSLLSSLERFVSKAWDIFRGFNFFKSDRDFTFKSNLIGDQSSCKSVCLAQVLVSSLQLSPEQRKWRIINIWLSARSDWTILRADQFPASLYCCRWWVTQLIITRESMPCILFSPLADWHRDAATLLHRHRLHSHTHNPHTAWGAQWLASYCM